MRIFSKFHDYYDSILAHGVDPKCVYERKEIEITESKDPRWKLIFENKLVDQIWESMPFTVSRYHRQDDYSRDNILVIFCGTIYPGFRLCADDPEDYYSCNEIVNFCYNVEQIESAMDAIKKQWIEYNNNKKKNRSVYTKYRHLRKFKPRYIKQFFNDYSGKQDESLIDLHMELDTPIISITTHTLNGQTITLDPILKDLEFYKAIDPYNTFQDLSMFVSGVMGGKSLKMVEIEDKYRKEMHGFDDMSFRKRKTG